MKHDEIKLNLFALVDGPLSETERALVESHIPSCAECQQALAEWKKISGVLFTLPAFSEALEDQFVSKVMDRLITDPRPKPQAPSAPWGFLRWILPLAGSAAAAAWVFFSVLPSTPGLTQGPSVENYFSDSDSSYSSSQSGIIPASDTEDMVVALIN